MKDRDVVFHRKWLGLAQPVEGLVFSVPVLADAQIAPEEHAGITAEIADHLDEGKTRITSLGALFERFLGYDRPGMLVPRAELPEALSFYAAEGGQEIRPSFAIARGPFEDDDPFAAFSDPKPAPAPADPAQKPWSALVWDLTEHGEAIDLDAAEAVTGPWRYPPTQKFERLLRHVGVPVGLLFNGGNLRLVYAPPGESTGHLTFRVPHLAGAEGRPLVIAMELLLGAKRAYSAAPEHTLEGLLDASRKRQADVTEALAKQVFEAVEILLGGFEAAAARDGAGDSVDWLRPALEAPGDHLYQGVLSVVLRLVFLLYAEDQALLPVGHPTYAAHLSVGGLYARLAHDAGAHPESMHHRFGAYGQLLALFRAVYFGVKHGSLDLPPRRGRLFDPNAYPFLEGGLPEWTAAVGDPAARAAARPPSVDDGTIHKVLHRLVVFEGQRLSYRTLDVEQIGSVYESLMGYHVRRVESAAVRVGKLGVWVEERELAAMSAGERGKFLKETCGLSPAAVDGVLGGVAADGGARRTPRTRGTRSREREGDGSENSQTNNLSPLVSSVSFVSFATSPIEALAQHTPGRRSEADRHRAAPGRLVLQPGEERRRTGSHYTPRSLTEKVVKRTLEPLLACLGETRTAAQILSLKICDPAMGSGAFLVAACRELAGEMVAAWTRGGEIAAILEAHGDAHLHARRLVAQTCLNGVDKNPAAVELAKLSLWLVTLSRTLPFTFVDHALRHGDSLVGLDFKQITAFHWQPQKAETRLIEDLLGDALEQAVELRQQIVALADHDDPASQADKRRLFDFSQQAIDRVRVVADACVGAFFAEAKDAARERERTRRLDLVEAWMRHEERAASFDVSEADRAKSERAADEARAEIEALAADARAELSPFHWWIEFPEVFFQERPDPLQGNAVNGAACFEGVVGNPPFMGGRIISSDLGTTYSHWLSALGGGSAMTADLSAHFLRRASHLLGDHGAFGLIATNSIAEGDTRAAGLAPMVAGGWKIYDAVESLPWPGAAAVMVALVHACNGLVRGFVRPVLDGNSVEVINSRLRARAERTDPSVLSVNGQSCLQGSILRGNGFAMPRAEAEAILAVDPSAHRVLRPYLGGDEINTSPELDFERYAISFGAMELEAARAWPRLLRIVEQRVRPERDRARDTAGFPWWQFWRARAELYALLSVLPRCMVTANVSKHMMFSYQPTDRLFGHTLYVFPLAQATAFSTLPSRIHEAWARHLSSSLRDTLRYSASDCFETFPFPSPDPRTVIPSLEDIGERLYAARAAFMVDTNQGLTKTYNALKDPACDDPRVIDLRRLHEAMDRAVLDAYGWQDVAVPPYCPASDEERAAVSAFEDEVIDRLHVLNAERAREEQLRGLSKASGRGAKAPAMEKAPGVSPVAVPASAEGEGPAPPRRRGRAPRGGGQGDLF